MKENYKRAVDHLENLKDEWQDRMDLNHYDITHRYMEAYRDDDHLILADTTAFWEYRHATVKFWLPAIVRLDPPEIEDTLVHEYTHILTASMESKFPEKHADLREFAVESIARALLRNKRYK